MCNKVNARIACEACNFEWKSAVWPDDWDKPLSCQATMAEIDKHLEWVKHAYTNLKSHYWDCKCIICR